MDLKITLNNLSLNSSLVQLTTNGMDFIFSDIVKKYGANKGIYV